MNSVMSHPWHTWYLPQAPLSFDRREHGLDNFGRLVDVSFFSQLRIGSVLLLIIGCCFRVIKAPARFLDEMDWLAYSTTFCHPSGEWTKQ